MKDNRFGISAGMGNRSAAETTELRAWREQRNWSLDRAGRKVGVSGVAFGRYERRERFPKSKVLHKIVALTGLSADQILGLGGAK